MQLVHSDQFGVNAHLTAGNGVSPVQSVGADVNTNWSTCTQCALPVTLMGCPSNSLALLPHIARTNTAQSLPHLRLVTVLPFTLRFHFHHVLYVVARFRIWVRLWTRTRLSVPLCMCSGEMYAGTLFEGQFREKLCNDFQLLFLFLASSFDSKRARMNLDWNILRPHIQPRKTIIYTDFCPALIQR